MRDSEQLEAVRKLVIKGSLLSLIEYASGEMTVIENRCAQDRTVDDGVKWVGAMLGVIDKLSKISDLHDDEDYSEEYHGVHTRWNEMKRYANKISIKPAFPDAPEKYEEGLTVAEVTSYLNNVMKDNRVVVFDGSGKGTIIHSVRAASFYSEDGTITGEIGKPNKFKEQVALIRPVIKPGLKQDGFTSPK